MSIRAGTGLVISLLLASLGSPISAQQAPEKEAGEQASPSEPAQVSPASLAITGREPEIALALAIGCASRGEFATALQRLEAALVAAEGRAELEQESARIRELTELRKRMLDRSRQGGSSLRLGNVQGKLLEFDDDTLTLDAGSGKRRTLPLTEVTPQVMLRLHKQGGSGAVAEPGVASAWLLAGAGALRENLADWSRKAAGPAAAALFDEQARYDGLLVSAEVAQDLLLLAGSPVPTTDAEASSQLRLLERLLGAQAADEFVVRRAEVLEQLARQALGVSFDKEPAPKLGLSGRCVSLPQGRVRLTYSFDSPDELADFEALDVAYLKRLRDSVGPLPSHQNPGTCQVREGALTLSGAVARRSRFQFTAPWVVDYEFHWTEDETTGTSVTFAVGICDDGKGQVIRCHDVGWIDGADSPSDLQLAPSEPEELVLFDRTFHMIFAHDGKQVKSTLDGAATDRAPAETIQRGALLLWIHSALEMVIEQLVVEGTPDPAWLASRRQAFIEQQLADLKR